MKMTSSSSSMRYDMDMYSPRAGQSSGFTPMFSAVSRDGDSQFLSGNAGFFHDPEFLRGIMRTSLEDDMARKYANQQQEPMTPMNLRRILQDTVNLDDPLLKLRISSTRSIYKDSNVDQFLSKEYQ